MAEVTDSAVIVTTLMDYWWMSTVLNTVSRKHSKAVCTGIFIYPGLRKQLIVCTQN